MKKTILWIILFININLYCQNLETSNIFLQEFNYGTEMCFKDKNNHLIFFSKYYADKKLKMGIIDINDTIVLKNLKEKKSVYEYYIKRTHVKDTLKGVYNLNEFLLTDKYDTVKLKKIVFKCLPKEFRSYECDDYVYQNVLCLKLFSSTGAILTMDEEIDRIRLRLIKEDCSLAYSEEFLNNDLKYSEEINFLVIKNKSSFIFIFDRFLR